MAVSVGLAVLLLATGWVLLPGDEPASGGEGPGMRDSADRHGSVSPDHFLAGVAGLPDPDEAGEADSDPAAGSEAVEALFAAAREADESRLDRHPERLARALAADPEAVFINEEDSVRTTAFVGALGNTRVFEGLLAGLQNERTETSRQQAMRLKGELHYAAQLSEEVIVLEAFACSNRICAGRVSAGSELAGATRDSDGFLARLSEILPGRVRGVRHAQPAGDGRHQYPFIHVVDEDVAGVTGGPD